MYKHVNESKKSIENSSPPYMHQTYTPTVILKHKSISGPSNRMQVVHPRPQTTQGELVVMPEASMLIILGLAYKSDIIW